MLLVAYLESHWN